MSTAAAEKDDQPAARFGKDQLKAFVERIERLEEEKKTISDDIRDVYAEAKAVGYDAKIMRQIVRLRKMKPDDRREMELLDERRFLHRRHDGAFGSERPRQTVANGCNRKRRYAHDPRER